MDEPDENIVLIIENLNKVAPANDSIHAEKLALFLKKLKGSSPGSISSFKNAIQICSVFVDRLPLKLIWFALSRTATTLYPYKDKTERSSQDLSEVITELSNIIINIQNKMNLLTDLGTTSLKEIFSQYTLLIQQLRTIKIWASNLKVDQIESLRKFYLRDMTSLFRHDYKTNCDYNMEALYIDYEQTILSRAILLFIKSCYFNHNIDEISNLRGMQDQMHAEVKSFTEDVLRIVNSIESVCPLFLASYTLKYSVPGNQFKPVYIPDVNENQPTTMQVYRLEDTGQIIPVAVNIYGPDIEGKHFIMTRKNNHLVTAKLNNENIIEGPVMRREVHMNNNSRPKITLGNFNKRCQWIGGRLEGKPDHNALEITATYKEMNEDGKEIRRFKFSSLSWSDTSGQILSRSSSFNSSLSPWYFDKTIGNNSFLNSTEAFPGGFIVPGNQSADIKSFDKSNITNTYNPSYSIESEPVISIPTPEIATSLPSFINSNSMNVQNSKGFEEDVVMTKLDVITAKLEQLNEDITIIQNKMHPRGNHLVESMSTTSDDTSSLSLSNDAARDTSSFSFELQQDLGNIVPPEKPTTENPHQHSHLDEAFPKISDIIAQLPTMDIPSNIARSPEMPKDSKQRRYSSHTGLRNDGIRSTSDIPSNIERSPGAMIIIPQMPKDGNQMRYTGLTNDSKRSRSLSPMKSNQAQAKPVMIIPRTVKQNAVLPNKKKEVAVENITNKINPPFNNRYSNTNDFADSLFDEPPSKVSSLIQKFSTENDVNMVGTKNESLLVDIPQPMAIQNRHYTKKAPFVTQKSNNQLEGNRSFLPRKQELQVQRSGQNGHKEPNKGMTNKLHKLNGFASQLQHKSIVINQRDPQAKRDTHNPTIQINGQNRGENQEELNKFRQSKHNIGNQKLLNLREFESLESSDNQNQQNQNPYQFVRNLLRQTAPNRKLSLTENNQDLYRGEQKSPNRLSRSQQDLRRDDNYQRGNPDLPANTNIHSITGRLPLPSYNNNQTMTSNLREQSGTQVLHRNEGKLPIDFGLSRLQRAGNNNVTAARNIQGQVTRRSFPGSERSASLPRYNTNHTIKQNRFANQAYNYPDNKRVDDDVVLITSKYNMNTKQGTLEIQAPNTESREMINKALRKNQNASPTISEVFDVIKTLPYVKQSPRKTPYQQEALRY